LATAAARIPARIAAEVAAGVGFGVGVATFTPLFHTSFVPDLMQVYLTPAETVVDLSLTHLVPALVAALEGAISCVRKSDTQIEASRWRFIGKL
jgi:hypothetical protein